ncbi:ATP-dependent nuclease [Arthrobacter sp. TmT3-37]
MKLTELRVRNYRTIAGEQTIRLNSGTTLVGPNNSGKTNLLRSVQLFFTGYENEAGYDKEVDLTFGAGSQRTSLVASFALDGHPRDEEVASLLSELHEIVGTERESESFSVNLYFAGANNTPVYRVFANTKVPNEADRPAFSRKQKQLIEILMSTFRCHFVPSAKSTSRLYQDLLQPFLTEIAAEAIEPHLKGIQEALGKVSDSLNDQLSSVGLGQISATFALQGTSRSRLLTGFELLLSDPQRTPIGEKGQGIQSTALFASFVWITQQEQAAGHVPIWLIEEPESYLHPELSKSCQELLGTLAQHSLVVLTTHSLSFVPPDLQRIQGVDLDTHNRTVVSSFTTHRDATGRIRDALGVQFSDYYNLGQTNILVEGPSDVELLVWAVKRCGGPEDYPLIRQAYIDDFGGVKQLEGFLKAVFEPISLERALVSVFDGDEAGNKSRQNLQQYFGQKNVQFQPNIHFVSIRTGYAVEGLFPDSWLAEAYEQHPGWFDSFSVDAVGAVEPFVVKDRNKSNLQNLMQKQAEDADDLEWAGRWLPVLNAIEAALKKQLDKLNHGQASTA